MIDSLLQFLHMGGYGCYVWPAYISVIFFLALQLFIPWKRWRNYLQKKSS